MRPRKIVTDEQLQLAVNMIVDLINSGNRLAYSKKIAMKKFNIPNRANHLFQNNCKYKIILNQMKKYHTACNKFDSGKHLKEQKINNNNILQGVINEK